MAAKKATSKKRSITKPAISPAHAYAITKAAVASFYKNQVSTPAKALLSRRPHRSFRRTRRRDYVRSLQLPGYWAFTAYVWKTIAQHRMLFGGLVVVYGFLTVALVGISSQDSYSQLRTVLQETSGSLFSGAWGELGKAGLLLFSGITGSFAPQLSEAQQIYAGFLVLFTWLTTVWLLRAVLAGNKPRLRDAIYNAGAPVVSTMLVAIVLLLQLVPLAIAIIGYSAATSTDLISSSGFLAMTVFFVALLLAVLSVYWVASTFMALIVVTLPGMYPWQAIRTAGDMVVGRRVRIVLRLLWLLASLALFWIIAVVPMIIFESWLVERWEFVERLQLVPITILIVSSFATVWASSYIYLLYRKVVEDDAAPA